MIPIPPYGLGTSWKIWTPWLVPLVEGRNVERWNTWHLLAAFNQATKS